MLTGRLSPDPPSPPPARGASGQSLAVPEVRSSMCAHVASYRDSVILVTTLPHLTDYMCSGSMSKGHSQGLGARTSPHISWGTHVDP